MTKSRSSSSASLTSPERKDQSEPSGNLLKEVIIGSLAKEDVSGRFDKIIIIPSLILYLQR